MSVAHSEGGSEAEDAEDLALLVTLSGLGLGIGGFALGTAIGNGELVLSGMGTVGVSLTLGPGLGFAYGGDWTRASLGSLGRFAVFGTGSLVTLVGFVEAVTSPDCDFEDDDEAAACSAQDEDGTLLLGLGTAINLVGVAWAFYDIFTTEESLKGSDTVSTSVGLVPLDGGALMTFTLSH